VIAEIQLRSRGVNIYVYGGTYFDVGRLKLFTQNISIDHVPQLGHLQSTNLLSAVTRCVKVSNNDDCAGGYAGDTRESDGGSS
jgi:hypothetical protein